MRRFWFSLALIWAACCAQAETVWIDTDASIGSPVREVDDGYALLLAFHSPEIRIAGLSTTYGNASLVQTTRVTRDLVQRFGASAGLEPLRIFTGAASPRDLGRRSPASEALAATLSKGKLTYVALGPLTNLATFLQLHPNLIDRIGRVILVGGHEQGASLAFGPTRSFRIHDANVFKDPAAAGVVLRSKIPLVLMPIDTAGRLQIEAANLDELASSGPSGAYLGGRSRIWLWFWTRIVKESGGPIFDALAILPTTRHKKQRRPHRKTHPKATTVAKEWIENLFPFVVPSVAVVRGVRLSIISRSGCASRSPDRSQKKLAGCECHARTSPDMKAALLLLGIGALWLSGCASNPDDPDQVKLGPSIHEQRQDAKKTEEFAKSLPKPRE